MDTHKTTLHSYKVQKTSVVINRVHILFHFIATLTLLSYRTSQLFHGELPRVAGWLITAADFIFTFIWILTQSFLWRPVKRTVYPENMVSASSGGNLVELPGIDVFVCTADPKKEPTVEVMNTVVSAMALDYPPEKLAVYVSDDGGSALTLCALKEACLFGRTNWIPFCRKYGIKSRCPEAYFSAYGDDERLLHGTDDEFKAEEEQIKSGYELFKENVEKASGSTLIEENCVVDDRPPCVEVIHDNRKDGQNTDEHAKMPLLVYVSREVTPSRPHRFKAGALNTLLRVSGIMSNGPYLLVLDCDMYCNDPTSARQAMCFHLEPQMSPSLSFVQFPQMFYNASENDIYDGQGRSAYKTKWQGMDGLSGPVFSGTGYYLKRKALYGRPNQEDEFLDEPKKNFGHSNKFIASLKSSNEQDHINGKGTISDEILREASYLASCSFEKNTNWGAEIGYTYNSLLESTFTGYFLHCKGWKSVYLYPKRPCFLGCTPIDMKDAVVQLMKWSSGCVQAGLSRFCPLVYGISRMSFLQTLCYAYFTFFPLYCIPLIIYGTVPQLCLLNGIPLFPKASDPWFAVFAVVFLSSLCQHLYEVLSSGGTIRDVWNEERAWVISSITACLFGCLDALMKLTGIRKTKFILTNKATDKEKREKYEKGKFNFDGAMLLMIPFATIIILNTVCLVSGVKTAIVKGTFEEMFGQVFIASTIILLGFSILEGLIPSKGGK